MRTIPNECSSPGREGKNKMLPIYGTDWPTYGFDEWFLIAVVYPRLAFEGVLTFSSMGSKVLTHYFALGIEYVTWVNPKSEIVLCCETDELKAKKALEHSEKSKQ